MKKQLREQLVALAERIVQTRQAEDIPTSDLKALAQQLYEKLTVLTAAENFIGSPESDAIKDKKDDNLGSKAAEAFETAEKNPETTPPVDQEELVESQDEHDHHAPDGTEWNDDEGITEPNTEMIKDIVAQMPPESHQVDEMLEYILPHTKEKEEREEFGGLLFDNLPQFEPVDVKQKDPEKPRSLNDRLKKGIHIGINDRHAFVRNLFDGSTADYNRVLSQLNTIKTKEEAFNFILHMVKPDYNNWEGKEVYENRFLDIVDNRFD